LVRKTILIQKTKSGRPRTIPLNWFALGVLNNKFEERVRNIKELVFVSSVGSKINPSSLRKEFYKVLEKAEIENFKFHDLRHTFATRLAQKGIDIYKIAKLLGHEHGLQHNNQTWRYYRGGKCGGEGNNIYPEITDYY
jgi:integrase